MWLYSLYEIASIEVGAMLHYSTHALLHEYCELIKRQICYVQDKQFKVLNFSFFT